MYLNELPLEPHHLVVPSGMTKTISEPMVCLVQTTHLSCTDANTTSKRKEERFTWPTSPRSSIGCCQNDFLAYGTFDANRVPIWRQDYHYLQTYWNELPLEPRHLVLPSGVTKMISEPMVCLVQTMHLSCTDTNTTSKRKRREIPHDPCHQGVPLGACKIISDPIVHSTQTVHLSCVKISTIFKWTKTSFHLSLVT